MTTTLTDRIQALISRRVSAGTLPADAGIAVSVVQEGETICSLTQGLRDRGRQLPVAPRTVFPICSLTKAFTATALLIGRDGKPVELDSPINASGDVLPLRDAETSRKVTVADVLSHRTGMPPYDILWYFRRLDPASIPDVVSRLELVPGELRRGFLYNNLLYAALGRRFDAMFDEDWETAVTRRILQPLEMPSTRFVARAEGSELARPGGASDAEPRDLAALLPAGGMFSTLEDMTRWVAFHVGRGVSRSGRRLLPASSMERMHAEHISIENPSPLLLHGWSWLGPKFGYGLGWFLGACGNEKVVFHPGFIDGYSTGIALVPERRLGIVVLTNLDFSDVPGLLVREVLHPHAEELPGSRPPVADGAGLVGRYEHPALGEVSVVASGTGFVLGYGEHSWPLTLKERSAAEFVITALGTNIPMPVQIEWSGSRASRLLIPFSLDPRVISAFERVGD